MELDESALQYVCYSIINAIHAKEITFDDKFGSLDFDFSKKNLRYCDKLFTIALRRANRAWETTTSLMMEDAFRSYYEQCRRLPVEEEDIVRALNTQFKRYRSNFSYVPQSASLLTDSEREKSHPFIGISQAFLKNALLRPIYKHCIIILAIASLVYASKLAYAVVTGALMIDLLSTGHDLTMLALSVSLLLCMFCAAPENKGVIRRSANDIAGLFNRLESGENGMQKDPCRLV